MEIQPSWAKWQGEKIEYVFRGYDWDTIEGWKEVGEQANWNLDVRQSGRYRVAIRYGRSAHSGGALSISVGDQSLQCDPRPTPTADVFTQIDVGTITLKEGPAVLKAEVVSGDEQEILRLNGILLQRVR